MKKSAKMIDLGRKPASSEPSPAVKKNEPYYPSMSLSTDKPIDFPKGHFMAKLKLRMKHSSASTDEQGKTRHSYEIALHGIHPQFDTATEAADEASSSDASGTEDAAAALMHSMGRARDKKFIAHASA